MRLYRQGPERHWPDVIAMIARDLTKLSKANDKA
jgi:hypothetical protein